MQPDASTEAVKTPAPSAELTVQQLASDVLKTLAPPAPAGAGVIIANSQVTIYIQPPAPAAPPLKRPSETL